MVNRVLALSFKSLSTYFLVEGRLKWSFNYAFLCLRLVFTIITYVFTSSPHFYSKPHMPPQRQKQPTLVTYQEKLVAPLPTRLYRAQCE